MMNRRPMSTREMPVKTGYRHTRLYLSDYKPTSHWLVIKEELDRDISLDSGGIIHVPDAKAATLGTIMSLSEEAKALGLKEGDKVIYEAWQGGRWAFSQEYEELECLIMSLDSIWCIIR